MPRLPRLDAPGVPQRVIQRGNDRHPCFFTFTDADDLRYRSDLREIAKREGCTVHAYGSNRFRQAIEAQVGRSASPGRLLKYLHPG